MKTKALLKSFALCLIAIFTISAHAQISTNELPQVFHLLYSLSVRVM